MATQDIQEQEIEALAASGAPEQQLAKALYARGLDFATGHGVERDLIEAHKWLNLASVHGLPAAAVDRDELAKELTRREIRRALRRAREWHSSH